MISLVAVTAVFIVGIVAGILGHDVHWGRIIIFGLPLWFIWWAIYRLVVHGDDL